MTAKTSAQAAILDPHQERLLRMADVRFITGLSKTTIYGAVRAKTFPQPVRLTDHAVAWRKSEVDGWLAARPTARDGEGEATLPAVAGNISTASAAASPARETKQSQKAQHARRERTLAPKAPAACKPPAPRRSRAVMSRTALA